MMRAELSGASASGPSATVEFTIIGWAGEVSGLSYRQNGNLHSLQVPAYARSPVYKYSGPAQMGFYVKNPAAGKPGTSSEPKEMPVATVTLDPGVKRYTVLIAGGDNRYQAQAIADDEDKFPVGRARILNLCPFRLAIRCNQTSTVTLDSRQSAIVSPGADHVLAAETVYELGGEWKRANSDFIPAPPDRQTSIFLLHSEAKHFRSVDGIGSVLQMFILREKPADRDKAGVRPPQSTR